jgi:hypothetical protein
MYFDGLSLTRLNFWQNWQKVGTQFRKHKKMLVSYVTGIMEAGGKITSVNSDKQQLEKGQSTDNPSQGMFTLLHDQLII